jgi:hypothetical protein
MKKVILVVLVIFIWGPVYLQSACDFSPQVPIGLATNVLYFLFALRRIFPGQAWRWRTDVAC